MKRKDMYHVACIGTIVGVICFILIYGINILDVTYDGWLLQDASDLTQHYLGWKFYRDSPWQFPIGLVKGISIQDVSIIYTDSIPLMAIIFKILSPFLPETFQYFGMWGILSFALQGCLMAVILHRFVDNKIVITIGCGFACISSILVMRMYVHTALAAHWIILLAFVLAIYKDSICSNVKLVFLWSIVCVLCVCVHLYFLPMILGVLVFCAIDEYFVNKQIKGYMFALASSLFWTVVSMLVLGAFHGNSDVVSGGFGVYSANLNALFNNQGTSVFLNALPTYGDGQGEGYAYLGAGVIILLFIAVFVTLHLCIKDISKMYLVRASLVVLLCLVFAIYSFSNVITIGDKVLLHIPVPNFIWKLCGIFRASGRYLWPVFYVIMVYCIVIIHKKAKIKATILILGICLLLQATDLSVLLKSRHDKYIAKIEYSTPFDDELWEKVAEGKRKIEFLTFEHTDEYDENEYLWSKSQFTMAQIFQIGEFAHENDLILNDFYLGRQDREAMYLEKLQELEAVQSGNGKSDTIYIFNHIPISIIKSDVLNIYMIDGFVIGLKEEILDVGENKEITELKYDTLQLSVMPTEGEFLTHGEDLVNGRILYSNGVSYGPYITLPRGRYTIKLCGQKIQEIFFECSANKGEEKLNLQVISCGENEIVYEVYCEEDKHNVEFVLVNNHEENLLIEQMVLAISTS